MRNIGWLLLLSLLSVPAQADLAKARESVENIRGKKFKHAVQTKTIKRAELGAFISQQIAKSVGSTDEYQRVLETMQLVDRDPKLIEKLLALYESQVLAFYDPDTHAYYGFDELPASVPKLPMLHDLVDVHELTHALQDQLFDAGARMHVVAKDFDQGMAYHALLEGEASLVMLASMLSGLGQSVDDLVENEELLEAMAQATAQAPAMAGDAPKYFVDSMVFPYFDGLKFVIAAYKRGGWSAVDALHANPPRSTEEVLRPELYFARVASKKAMPLQSIGRVENGRITTDVGEFLWRHLLSAEAAAGTDGGTFAITRKGADSMAFIESRWDTEKDAVEFEKAYVAFLRGRNLKPEFLRRGKNVRVAYGADGKAARAFVAGGK